MISFNIVLFDDFETLDAFGPVEVIGRLKDIYSLEHYSLNGGVVKSSQHVSVTTKAFDEMDSSGVLLIPGGMGTRKLVNDNVFIDSLKTLAENSSNVLTVCTGSALLAKTKLLDGLSATSNKMALEWVKTTGENVNWVKKARWVKDGKFYTSSGVSAGIDMALGFVSDLHGTETALGIAKGIEYIWNMDMDNDPFTVT